MKNENYIVNELEKGRNLKILFISHNAYGFDLQQLEKFENCKIEISSCYAFKTLRKDKVEDFDLIFYYSSDYFDVDDLKYLDDKISKISQREQKRVTLGYTYRIPSEEMIDKDLSEKMKIISYNNDVKDEITTNIDAYTNPLNLAEMILRVSDEFDEIKAKKYI